MMSIQQLTTAPTVDQIVQQMLTWMSNQGLPVSVWRPGSVGLTIIYAVANAYVVLATLVSFIAQSGFLSTATGDFLTLLAYYVYGVTRVAATPATGQVQVSNSSGSIYPFTIGQFIVIASPTAENPGASYTNTSPFTLNPGDSNIDVDVEAVIAGSGSNAAPGDITDLGQQYDGVTVDNAAALLGQDAWSDSTLQAACLAKLGALSMLGPRGAYQYAIQTALNNGVPVNVNRFSISASSSTGIVTIYLASPSGPVTVGDLDAVEANITAVALPDSVTQNTNNTTTVSFSKTLTVWAVANKGTSSTTIQDEAEAAFEAYQAAYPIGGIIKTGTQGYMYDESVRAVVQAADPAIFAVDSGDDLDLPIGVSQTAVLTPTINVRMVTTPVTS